MSEMLKQDGQTATLQEHQNALYLLLQEFDRVCKKLNITYYLFAGTLLGAVRHQGFIPWDDDLDVLMPREDYRRLLREGPGVLDTERFFLQGEFSEHFPMFFSKLRLNGTTCLEKYVPKDPLIHHCVYMDIFPCDNAYGSKAGRLLQFAASKVVIAKGLYAEGYDTDSTLKKVFMTLCRCLPMKPFHRIVTGPKETKKQVHCYLGGARRMGKSTFPASAFAKTVALPFAQGTYSAPEGYARVLEILYRDYMTIPPEADRKCKEHTILVDLTRSYEHYKTYRDGMKFEVHTRSIR